MERLQRERVSPESSRSHPDGDPKESHVFGYAQHTLDNFLGIDAETELSTGEVLDAIQRLLRSRQSRFVDLTEFFSATQGPQEPF